MHSKHTLHTYTYYTYIHINDEYMRSGERNIREIKPSHVERERESRWKGPYRFNVSISGY